MIFDLEYISFLTKINYMRCINLNIKYIGKLNIKDFFNYFLIRALFSIFRNLFFSYEQHSMWDFDVIPVLRLSLLVAYRLYTFVLFDISTVEILYKIFNTIRYEYICAYLESRAHNSSYNIYNTHAFKYLNKRTQPLLYFCAKIL